ncbi:class I SAM-dependent methyltransferase [Streptomyces chartreusis]|uniref:class I SAM-dependent methyltransferase n=1 Tax=Streptomyces chartreusis TaxID=1969 RepID=UPI002E803AD1|nr:methyltransferase domain-containing protein [Streptomyces chartreusis]WUB20657.1 class I SAM-dependent methyltransferase [Streptomyces chartreusis]
MDYYADFAANYDCVLPEGALDASFVGITSPGSISLIQRVLDDLNPGSSVLDCACGIGLDALALARSGFRVTASDGSKAMINEARKRFRDSGVQVTAVHSEWVDLPTKLQGPFDLVLCTGNSIAHASSKTAMIGSLRSMHSVLRPNGLLIVDSRNWEALYRTRPRIMVSPRMTRKDGNKCAWVYVWTIPRDFTEPCRAEIVILLEGRDETLSHEYFTLEFKPFSFDDLILSTVSAGFEVVDTSYASSNPFYGILAQSK